MNTMQSGREEMIERLLATSPDCIYVYDLIAGRAIYRNRLLYEVLGYDVAAVDYPTAAIPQQFLHPEDRVDAAALLARLRGLPPRQVHTEEFRLRAQDGRWRHFAARITPLEWHTSGEVTRLLGTVSDVSAQKWAEQRAEDALRAAERASHAKSQFLAQMSHEIRTPLNGLLGTAQLLETTELTTEQGEYMRTLTRSGDVLLGIVNDVLDLSKIEAGHLKLAIDPLNLLEVCEQSLATFADAASAKNLALCLRYDPETPAVLLGDPHRLRQILANLIGNAVKFTEHGHVALSVETTRLRDAQWRLTFRVTDTGIGVSEEFQTKLFEKFSQALLPHQALRGTGLGLAIVKQLATLMGGKVGFTPAPEGGSEFIVAVTLTAPQVEQPSEPVVHPLAGKRIAIDGDHPASVRTLRDQMIAWGADVVEPGDGSAEVCITDRYDDSLPGDWVESSAPRISCPRRIVIAALGAPLAAASLLRDQGVIEGCLPRPISYTRLVAMIAGHPSAVTANTPAKPDAPRQRRLVLVVDDNQDNLDVVARMLDKSGYDYELAASGREALLAIERRRPDLVLMDCQMPDMDGFEATREIRRTFSAGDLPVIALTANVFASAHASCSAAGMNAVLTKPLRMTVLRDTLGSWINQSATAATSVAV